MTNKLHIAAFTDIGKVRTQNQDRYGIWKIDDNECLAIVADGMGGHSYGDVASEMVVDTIYNNLCQQREHNPEFKSSLNEFLVESIDLANHKILDFASNNNVNGGMGSTVVACYIEKSIAHIAHVGDSRAYLIRNNTIIKLTVDHSLAESNSKVGKHFITRAVGTEQNKQFIADILNLDLNSNDYLLLCTDGLTNELSDSEILHTCITKKDNNDVNNIVDRLIKEVNKRESHDNVTIILIHIM